MSETANIRTEALPIRQMMESDPLFTMSAGIYWEELQKPMGSYRTASYTIGYSAEV
jgi:hypothetical protein